MNVKRVLIMAILASFVVVGCGKKDGESGSNKSNHEKLQGTWKLNVDKMISADPKMAEMIKAKPEMKAKVLESMGGMSITIAKDTVTMTMMGEAEKSNYKIISQDGKKIVIEATEEGKDKKETLTFEFSDDDNVIGGKDGEKTQMHLTRSK